MEFVLIFSVIIYFLFQFLKFFVNGNLNEFKHIMTLRLREYSFKDDCHTILFKLAEQTLRIERTNGYNFHVNTVILPTSYYYYNLYKNKKSTNSNNSFKDFSSINQEKNINTIKSNNYYNNDVIQYKIEKSNFKYHNWINPNYNKYRNIYNINYADKNSEDFDFKKLNKSKFNGISNNNDRSKRYFNLFNIHHISSFLKNHIFLKNKYSLSHEIINNNGTKKANLLKKNWKCSDEYLNYNNEINYENKQNDEYNNKPVTSSSSNLHKNDINKNKSNKIKNAKYKHINNSNSEISDYSKFLYDTYEEDDDEDPLEDPSYIYSKTPSDIEENNTNFNIEMDKSKDTLYHELFDIMQDADVINGLKDQNIIIDSETSQNSGINLDLYDEESHGMITRSKYRKLLNSDDYLTASDGPSSQISYDKNSSNYKYSLPLRDTVASLSKNKSNNSSHTSDDNIENNKKRKWKNNLKKLNIFSHHKHNFSLEESSSSSSSSNNAKSEENTSDFKEKDPYEFYRRTCVICFDAQREIILWPCGCLCLCDDCREIMTFRSYKRCPCCQQEVNSYSKINLC